MRFTVAGLSFLLLVAVAGLVVVELRPGWLSGLRNAVPAPAPFNALGSPGTGPASAGRGQKAGAHGSTAANGAAPGSRGGGRTGSAPAGRSGPGAPYLAALQPNTGAPGDTLRMTGQNLFSSDGHIEVTFAGHPAPVRCPSAHSCLVTVPSLGRRPGTAPVAMLTASGRSNVVAFTYR